MILCSVGKYLYCMVSGKCETHWSLPSSSSFNLTLSSVAATGCPVTFIGTGEQALQPFTMKPFVKKLKGKAISCLHVNLVTDLGNHR